MDKKLKAVAPVVPLASFGRGQGYDWFMKRKVILFELVVIAVIASIILTDFLLFTIASLVLAGSYLYLHETVDNMLAALPKAAKRLPKTTLHLLRVVSFCVFLFIQAAVFVEYLAYIQLGNSDDLTLALLSFSAFDAALVSLPGIILIVSYFERRLKAERLLVKTAWLVLLTGATVGAAMLGAYYANLDSGGLPLGLLITIYLAAFVMIITSGVALIRKVANFIISS